MEETYKGNQHGKGRQAGSRNNATIAMEALPHVVGDAIARRSNRTRKTGNETAHRLCLDRLMPRCRERLVQLALPMDVTTAEAALGTVRRIDNQVLQFLLDRRNPEYGQRLEDSGAVEFHVMMQDLNADRQRVPVFSEESVLAVQQ